MSVINDLAQKHHFTETEANIADYILAHPDEVAGMSIGDLARGTFSSNAAIIRLCRKLGLDGYRQFRVALAADYEKAMHVQQVDDVDYPFAEFDDTGAIMRSVATVSQSAIEECYATINPARIENAAKLIRKADRIFVYAAGETLINATEFSNLLLKIGRTAIFPARYLESLPITTMATSKDVALVVSYSGYLLAGMQSEIELFKRNHTPVIVISSLKDCPEASLLITIPNREQRVGKIAGFYSQSAIKYVLGCLYASVYSLDMERNRTRKDHGDAYSYQGRRVRERFGTNE